MLCHPAITFPFISKDKWDTLFYRCVLLLFFIFRFCRLPGRGSIYAFLNAGPDNGLSFEFPFVAWHSKATIAVFRQKPLSAWPICLNSQNLITLPRRTETQVCLTWNSWKKRNVSAWSNYIPKNLRTWSEKRPVVGQHRYWSRCFIHIRYKSLFFQVYMPSVMVVMLSWIIFWVDMDSGNQVGSVKCKAKSTFQII